MPALVSDEIRNVDVELAMMMRCVRGVPFDVDAEEVNMMPKRVSFALMG